MKTLIFTHSPFDNSTLQGIELIDNLCQNHKTDFHVFLYGEAVHLANPLTWLPADMPNPAKTLQNLAKTHNFTIQVCVSTALARGVVDGENAKRHGLTNHNIAENFSLVGLGELAMHLHNSTYVYQF
nr:DsrE family protein [uncultured Moraxella sp.]